MGHGGPGTTCTVERFILPLYYTYTQRGERMTGALTTWHPARLHNFFNLLPVMCSNQPRENVWYQVAYILTGIPAGILAGIRA
jgi:hypothetical protein